MPDEPRFKLTRHARSALLTQLLNAAVGNTGIGAASEERLAVEPDCDSRSATMPSIQPRPDEVVLNDPAFAARATDQARRVLAHMRDRYGRLALGEPLLTGAHAVGPVWRADYWRDGDAAPQVAGRLMVWRNPGSGVLHVGVSVGRPDTPLHTV